MDKLPQEFLFRPLGFKLHTLYSCLPELYRQWFILFTIDNIHLSFLFDDIPIETRLIFLFNLRGLTMSVTWTSKHFFLFNSHSQDVDGKIKKGNNRKSKQTEIPKEKNCDK